MAVITVILLMAGVEAHKAASPAHVMQDINLMEPDV